MQGSAKLQDVLFCLGDATEEREQSLTGLASKISDGDDACCNRYRVHVPLSVVSRASSGLMKGVISIFKEKEVETMKDNQGDGGIVIRTCHSVFCKRGVRALLNRLDNQTDSYLRAGGSETD